MYEWIEFEIQLDLVISHKYVANLKFSLWNNNSNY